LTEVKQWERRCATMGRSLPQMAQTLPDTSKKKSELKAFLFLTVVMAPVLAGMVIGIYGLAVWIYQMFAGPPTG
jgi:periplasmic nitrate reductase NapE